MSNSPSINQRISELEAQHHELEAAYHRMKAIYYRMVAQYEEVEDALAEIENEDMQTNGRTEEHEQEYRRLDTMPGFLGATLDALRHEIPNVFGVIKRDAQAEIQILLEALRSSED
jgi:chromosome segregation ATPase